MEATSSLSSVRRGRRALGKAAASAAGAAASGGQAQGAYAGSGGRRAGAQTRRPIPPKLYRIGEVVDYSGVSRQTIHNYTTMGLLRESQWTRGGHRLYDESVFRRLDKIVELKSEDKSLEDIRNYFQRTDKSR